ncbi:hypothetical protein OPV22_013182 [Ensete ventricosum]|uniref:Uncharacterized protein n=1 Tax=Ensete ventricosum TaxID=4639 RepID=A0AAV8R950_ENSVE|nr:hypothetical protein OPV22_013182 [Ensete ventricosum]
MIPIHRKRSLQPLSRSLPSLSVSIRDGETLSAAGSHGSPGLAPARLAADGGRLPTVGLGVEGRDQGRHLLHNVRLLRQPLPARRFPSPSTSSSAAVHGAVSPAAVVVDSGHLLLLLPSAAVRRRRRRLLLPSAGKHLLQNAAAAQPLPTLLPFLPLQPPSTLRLQFRRCSLELLLHLHVLLHPSLPLLPRVGDPFSLPSLNAPTTLPETSLLALPIPSDRSQNAPGAAVKAAAAGAAEEGKKEGETVFPATTLSLSLSVAVILVYSVDISCDSVISSWNSCCNNHREKNNNAEICIDEQVVYNWMLILCDGSILGQSADELEESRCVQ